MLLALSWTSCAVPSRAASWFAAAGAFHEAGAELPAPAAILHGFDDPGPAGRLERGDRVLYGVRFADDTYFVLLEVADAPAAENAGGADQPVVGPVRRRIPVVPPAAGGRSVRVATLDLDGNCRIAATVFDGAGAPLGRATTVVSPGSFCQGLVPYCAARRDRYLGGSTTCVEFLEVIHGCDNLRRLLERAVAVEWWSVLRHFGVELSVAPRFDLAVPWGERYRFPLGILVNGEPALDCSIVVGPPRSPHNVGAGVLSIVAMRPGDTEPTVTLRLLAARRGGPGVDG